MNKRTGIWTWLLLTGVLLTLVLLPVINMIRIGRVETKLTVQQEFLKDIQESQSEIISELKQLRIGEGASTTNPTPTGN